MYYTGNNCTGDAYIASPVGSNALAGLRGSSYGIGRKVGATPEGSLVIRGTGTGTNNGSTGTAILNSQFRPSRTPACDTGTTTNNTVFGVQVMDLSGFTLPFVVE